MISKLLLSGAVRAAVVLAVGLLAYLLLARAAAATRRLVLVLALVAAVVVPIAAAVGPRWSVETPAVFAHESELESRSDAVASSTPSTGPQPTIPPVLASPGIDPTGAILVAWLAIALALLARATVSQLRVRAIVRRATPVTGAPWNDVRRIEIKVSFELDSPVVAGLFRPTIVIPQAALAWPVERCRLVVVHELAHIGRRDVLVQAIASVACAIQWCNPLVWICARRLAVECEIAADDAVLAAGVRPSRYAEELVAVATSMRTPSAAFAMAERSSLETRVTSILASRVARNPLGAPAKLAVVAIAAVLAAAAACTSPQDAQPPGVTGTATDPAIQRVAEQELATLATEWAPDLATIIVLDPASGEILANTGVAGGKPADVASMMIAPGSTLKVVTIAAALEVHAITPDQTFDCAPRAYADKVLRDYTANRTLDVAHILAVSSNIGVSRIFDSLGGDNLALWLHRFHFAAVPAQIATASYEGSSVANGSLAATPLEIIAAYGTIAGDGIYHAPAFDRGGSKPERVVSADTAHAVMAMLETAVVDGAATGKAARIAGVHVAGKTGTSQYATPDGREQTYASFVGIADLPSRRLVVLVGIAASRSDLSGGQAAAPVFARLVKQLR